MLSKKAIQKTVARFFKGYDKNFVNELARLLILFGAGFKIDTPDRLALFLTHVKAEVDVKRDGTVRMREWMNYSETRLKEVFRFFRRNPKLAKKYGKTKYHKANQKMIANYAYAKRLGNGGVKSGDGWKYRGWGIFQTTGKDNFRKNIAIIEQVTGMQLHALIESGDVSWLDNYTMGILAGMADWYGSKMYKAKTVNESTEIINYYTDSYAKRRKYYYQVKKIVSEVV